MFPYHHIDLTVQDIDGTELTPASSFLLLRFSESQTIDYSLTIYIPLRFYLLQSHLLHPPRYQG